MQRKVVTVLFCDVVGSTSLGENVDPEALRALLARYFEQMKAIVERHGGTVEKFIGDAVMAVFGVPTVHEDDAVRALQAAAEMQLAMPELGIEGRIGICTGEVVTGTEERLATGDAVNVAARLQSAAEPGETLLDQTTLRLAQEAVDAEPIEPLELKGKAEPVPAWRLVSVSTMPAERQFDSPLVGRGQELQTLSEAWERVRSGPGCELVTVVASAGVGKSRLVAEFLAVTEATVVRGRCLSYGEGITYWPVVEVLKQLEPQWSRVELDAAATEALDVVLGGDGMSSPDEIAWAFRKLLEGVAAEGPLVAVFDDIQWAEGVLLDLLEHLRFCRRAYRSCSFAWRGPSCSTAAAAGAGWSGCSRSLPRRPSNSWMRRSTGKSSGVRCASGSCAPQAETRSSWRRWRRWCSRPATASRCRRPSRRCSRPVSTSSTRRSGPCSSAAPSRARCSTTASSRRSRPKSRDSRPS